MKHKKRKKLRDLERRVIELELNSKATSFYFGVGITFPEYVKRTEKIIAQAGENTKLERQ